MTGSPLSQPVVRGSPSTFQITLPRSSMGLRAAEEGKWRLRHALHMGPRSCRQVSLNEKQKWMDELD
ncbi:hypothetical protein Y1Q_0003212 [Alligator mississippiensis]|uniref:Uncharacterized protein n=1 Tax=Alligator mississippiensis TaxID=8496 RepID=A0A151MDZ3_ALLMI|nr:hypothetical protein Y1Q_0003212 [Alligator mississippiensis]